MRHFDESQMVDIVEAAAGDRLELARRMASAYPGYEAVWLKDGVEAGDFKIAKISVAGQPIALCWYWVARASKTLVVNCSASLVRRDISRDYTSSLESLGRMLGCTSVSMESDRPAIARYLKRFGYVAQSVKYRKMI